MARVDKLYSALDALVEEYRGLLIKEFEKGKLSSYLHHCRDNGQPKRAFSMHGEAADLGEANDLLSLEKQIRQLSLKLKEPLPLPVQLLDEYAATYLELKKNHTTQPWIIKEFETEHNRLKKQLLQRLIENK